MWSPRQVTHLRGFAKLNKFQKSKKKLEVGGWVQVLFGYKKIGKSSKNKVLLGGARGAT